MRSLLACLALAAAALAAPGCAFPPPKITVSGPAPVALPFRVAADGLVLLRGRVNGAHDVEFILDTGAPVTVLIDNARTRALALDTSGARRLGPAGDPASPTGVIRGGFDIAFGRVRLSALTAVVIPGASLPCPERFEAIGFGGVVGGDLFRRFVVEIDWSHRLVRLHEPSAWAPPAFAREVPVAFESDHPYVDATITLPDGRATAARLHLDTGMNPALSLATGPGSAFATPSEGKPRSSCFVNGQAHAREGPPVALALAGATLGEFAPLYAPAKGASATRRVGAIGAAALSRHRIHIDFPRGRLFIGG